jgi:hypothetical protein
LPADLLPAGFADEDLELRLPDFLAFAGLPVLRLFEADLEPASPATALAFAAIMPSVEPTDSATLVNSDLSLCAFTTRDRIDGSLFFESNFLKPAQRLP